MPQTHWRFFMCFAKSRLNAFASEPVFWLADALTSGKKQ
jgi:hypothetical protein